MKITVGQLKQLIREQVEEMAGRKSPEPDYGSAMAQDVMIGAARDEEGLDPEQIEAEWTEWLADHKKEIRDLAKAAGRDQKKTIEQLKAKFFAKAEYDPDFDTFGLDVKDLFPSITRRPREAAKGGGTRNIDMYGNDFSGMPAITAADFARAQRERERDPDAVDRRLQRHSDRLKRERDARLASQPAVQRDIYGYPTGPGRKG